MKYAWLVVLLVGVLAVSPVLGYAAEGDAAGDVKWTLSVTKDYTPSPWVNETGYGTRVAHKLGFGLKNLLLGWTDLFVEPKEAADAGTNVLKGIGYGLKDLVENTVGGAVHVLTFPITAVDAPLPEGGVQF